MQLSTQLFARSAILIAVQVSMTVAAQGDQVLLGIISGLAAELFVVNFEIRHRAARLASPAVSPEYLIAKFFIRLGVKP